MTTDSIRVLAVCGSLRKGSFNRALLKGALDLAKEANLQLDFEVAEIRDFPLYDADLQEKGYPAPVQKFRDQIAAADAVLFVSPEYNYSVPGVLKNAIDWGSRAPAQPFNDKPYSVMGASAGMGGTMRMQYHLRQVAVFLNMHPLNGPEVFVRNAKDEFSDDLKLKNQATKDIVLKHLRALEEWTRLIKRGREVR